MRMHESEGRPLLGFDEHGEVSDAGHVVHRTIRQDYKAEVARLYRAYRDGNLAAKGIVDTVLLDDGDLEHRKLVTSYPFEWPANMYKDAVLFHLGLFTELDKSGLTLKDALPSNILFDHTTPVFVDFLSLVRRENLGEAAWLGAEGYADPRFAVARKMLLPYMILPLLFMARGDYRTARDLLSWRSCNCEGTPPAWSELLRPTRRPDPIGFRSYLRSLGVAAEMLPARYGARWRGPGTFPALVRTLQQRVQPADVTPPLSAYSSYYDEKKEAHSFVDESGFLPKQKAVHDLFRARAPRTVLDLGANTGWYSVLAAQSGASVIAMEEDESCVDILYRRAKRQRLKILPLKISFGDLTKTIHCARNLAPAPGASDALYRAAVERLGAELVLALGILHHLVLGEARTLDAVFKLLGMLAARTLVLEFVALDDEKIVEEPGFFPNLARFDTSTYNLALVRDAGLRHFARVKLLASHPASRMLLVFDR